MSDDLVKRLRGWVRDIHEGSTALWAMDQDLKAAADRIEELEAENARLKADKAKLMVAADRLAETMTEYSKYTNWFPQKAYDDLAKYRTTLAELKGGKDE